MIQLVSPNLSIVGQIGYCLSYARQCFGAAAVEPNAWVAWNNTKFKHTDALPADVCVPMWYSYVLNGENLGHVTINVPGQGIYSSPWKSSQTHAVLSSIAQVEQIYGVKYVGWSEDISNVKVVQGDSMPTADEVKSAFRQYNVNGEDGTPQTPTANQLAYYTGSPWTKLLDDLLHYVSNRESQEVSAANGVNASLQSQLDTLRAEYNALKATPNSSPDPNSVTITQTGLWAAFKKFLGL